MYVATFRCVWCLVVCMCDGTSQCVCFHARESVCSRSRLRQLILHHVHCSQCNLCLCSGRSSALKYCVALHVNGLKPYCVYWFGFNKFTCKLGDFESIVSQRWANYSRNEKLDTYKNFKQFYGLAHENTSHKTFYTV